jgi:RNA polymerase sigma-70 factor (ECF subfamily)
MDASDSNRTEAGSTASGSGSAPASQGFTSTHWSVVLAAADQSSPAGAQALEQLCRVYWPPVYAYVRRHGRSPADAEDLTQAFFARMLERGVVARADPGRGRFRSYLLTCLKHYLIDQHRYGEAQRRQVAQVPVMGTQIEAALAVEGLAGLDPEKVYARQWALTLLAEVLTGLKHEMTQNTQGELYELLRPHLCGDEEAVPYRELAVQTGLGEGALRMRVLRLRERYGERLRETIAHTVATPEEVDEEIRFLMRALTMTSQ